MLQFSTSYHGDLCEEVTQHCKTEQLRSSWQLQGHQIGLWLDLVLDINMHMFAIYLNMMLLRIAVF